ncbi:MAG: chemotaxis response regulator protein-glutamate methylesterase [Planctomycetota bacterium]|nr:chemotaxis response regulator protein-glutamate methylesterase [Planctomycetota bacterium]
MDNIRVMVVDDTVTYRKIVSDVLAGVPGIEVVSSAANGKIALAKIEQLRPDILTLDLEMPEMDGLEVLRQLKQTNSDVGAIVLSGSSAHGAESTMTALSLGAFDFVAKPAGGSSEENVLMLQQDLRPKIEAFARTRRVHNILHGHQTPPLVTMPAPSSMEEDDVAEQKGSGTFCPNGPQGASHKRCLTPFSSGRVDMVAVGISTGGPQALNRMLPQLPADLPVPVLIVQHMPPLFTKSLADDLDKRCELTVCEAADGQPVAPGHVLIAPGGKQMKVVDEGGQASIRITDDPPENSCRPSVDCLFRSATRAYGPNAIGVIMTGMGNDGAQGCRQMKQRGATIIAQDEDTCVVFGMPREPVEEGIADIVAPLDEIATEIVRLVRQGVAACK